MAKNPNRKAKPVKRNDPMNGAMKFFLGGCFAELYLLIARRFYIYGTAEQAIAWDGYLPVFGWIGAAILVIGAILTFLWKADKKRIVGLVIAAAGAFLAAASFLAHWNMSTLTLLSVVVPVVMLLGIVWSLYDRECALALTILAASLIAVWLCRRSGLMLVKGAAVIYLLILVVIFVLAKQNKLTKLLPVKADPLPVFVACVLSIVAVAIALVNTTIAYYAMWALAAVVFALAVYYTVKQL